MKVGIYGFRNKEKPEKWYVGQSVNIENRWNEYRLLRCKSQPKWYNALVKHGYEGFDAFILEECEAERLSEREEFWVKEKNSVENGYNCKSGGYKGGKHSEETKQKLRLAKLGKPNSPESNAKRRLYHASPETKAKISASLIGNQYHAGVAHTEETKSKISAWGKNRCKSPEHRAKIAAAHLKRNRERREKQLL